MGQTLEIVQAIYKYAISHKKELGALLTALSAVIAGDLTGYVALFHAIAAIIGAGTVAVKSFQLSQAHAKVADLETRVEAAEAQVVETKLAARDLFGRR